MFAGAGLDFLSSPMVRSGIGGNDKGHNLVGNILSARLADCNVELYIKLSELINVWTTRRGL